MATGSAAGRWVCSQFAAADVRDRGGARSRAVGAATVEQVWFSDSIERVASIALRTPKTLKVYMMGNVEYLDAQYLHFDDILRIRGLSDKSHSANGRSGEPGAGRSACSHYFYVGRELSSSF